MKKWPTAITVLVVVLALAGLAAQQNPQQEGNVMSETMIREEKHDIEAMYIPYGDSSFVMIDQETGSPFTVRMPKDIQDIKGSPITADDLKRGNILRITGDGIMLESYPGQYPGVTNIRVVKNGHPSDADQYQQVIDGIYKEPDPAQRPYLNLEYVTDLAAVTAMTDEGSYSWSYKDESGRTQGVTEESPHILMWQDITDISLDKPSDVTLWFSSAPSHIKVTRFSSEYRGEQEYAQSSPAGEEVPVINSADAPLIESVCAGYIYLVQGEWEQGRVDYGFLVK